MDTEGSVMTFSGSEVRVAPVFLEGSFSYGKDFLPFTFNMICTNKYPCF